MAAHGSLDPINKKSSSESIVCQDGSKNRVGNPLAKDYLHRVEDGTLRAATGDHANRALLLSKLCSYWKNNQERIE
jgi:DNA polymerase gamma 1